MVKQVGGVVAPLVLSSTVVAAAGVVKVKFESEGLFITGSSKTTGNGSQFTVCGYEDAVTGAFLGELQQSGIAFNDEDSLREFCASQAPTD